jgi:hypothetical protein
MVRFLGGRINGTLTLIWKITFTKLFTNETKSEFQSNLDLFLNKKSPIENVQIIFNSCTDDDNLSTDRRQTG